MNSLYLFMVELSFSCKVGKKRCGGLKLVPTIKT